MTLNSTHNRNSCSPLAELLVFPDSQYFPISCERLRARYCTALLDFSHRPDSWCSFEDDPNLELSHRIPATVGLTISRHVVLSPLFPDAVAVGVYDCRKLIRLCAMVVFIGLSFFRKSRCSEFVFRGTYPKT
jgi:hypothetical protein